MVKGPNCAGRTWSRRAARARGTLRCWARILWWATRTRTSSSCSGARLMEISRRSRGGRTARRTSSRRLCRRRRSTLRRPSASALLLALTVAWRASSSSRHPRLYQSCGPRCGPSRSFPTHPSPLPVLLLDPFPSLVEVNKTIIIYQACGGRAFGRADPASAPRLALGKATFPIAPEACAGPRRAPFFRFRLAACKTLASSTGVVDLLSLRAHQPTTDCGPSERRTALGTRRLNNAKWYGSSKTRLHFRLRRCQRHHGVRAV